MFFSKKLCVFSLGALIIAVPGALFAEEILPVASQNYVDNQLLNKQGKDTTQVYKIGQNGAWVAASNAVTVDTTYLKKTDNAETGATQVAIDTTKIATSGANGLDDESTKLVQEKAVAEALSTKQAQPASVATGKVLTYTGPDAGANVSAAYITVPISTAAPSTVTPTGFVELWVQPATE